MEKSSRKQPVGAADLRIRLEGAAETVEKAVERYRWARGLFKEPWRSRAGRHAAALERMKNEEPLLEEAVQKIERIAEREGWGPDSEPRRLVDQLRRARAELIAHLDPLLALTTPLTETGRFSDHFASGRIVWMLEYVLAELVPPTSAEPLHVSRLGPAEVSRVFPGLLGSIAISLILSYALRSSPCAISIFLLGPGVVAPLAYWRSRSRLEVLPDRLRLKLPFRQPRELRLPKGGIHYQPLSAQLSIAGFGTLTFHSVDDAAATATLIELCTHPPFDALGTAPTADANVFDASRTTGRTGALLLAGKRTIFIEDGPAAFDAAIGRTGSWASPKARLLARAVLALDQAGRGAMFDRLLASGAAHEIDLGAELLVSRGALRAGDLKIEVGERQAREVQRRLRNG